MNKSHEKQLVENLTVQLTDDFLTTCALAKAAKKFVIPDQGGELHGSPQMLKVFKEHNHPVLLTAKDASNQNSVERHHQTTSNAVRATLTGANLSIKFWPHCLSHALQMINSLPSKGQTVSPIEITTNQRED